MPYQTYVGSQAQLLSDVSNVLGMYSAGDILTVKARIYQQSSILGGAPFYLTTMGVTDGSSPDIAVTFDKFELLSPDAPPPASLAHSPLIKHH